MNMTVKKDEPMQIIPVNETAAIMSMVARAASDPACDMDKMERLMQMHERMQARQAEVDFSTDLAAMQTELPSVTERGKAKVNGDVRYTFSLWEDINTAIKPILSRHGFALSFRTDFSDGIAITGVLSHRSGHSERTTIKLPADASGSKNAVQAVASSVSYGKRYTASALLNLTSHGEDDDAYMAATNFITDEQAANIDTYIESTGSNKTTFLGIFKVETTARIKAADYERAIKLLKDKEAKTKGAK